MHIVMLGHKIVPSREGGVEVAVGELASRMVRRGHQVTCLNRRRRKAGAAQAVSSEWEGVRLREVPTAKRRGLAAITASFCASLLAGLGPYDVVHIHAEGSALWCWFPKLMGKKVVVTVHGLDHKRAKWGPLASYVILLGEKTAVRFADEIIVLSQAARQYFQETYGRQTVYIPNGAEAAPARSPELIRQRWGLEKDRYFLFLGRLVPEKGLKCLLEAWKGVRTDRKLVIAGSGSDTEEFVKELKALSAEDSRVLFPGFVEGTVLEELYSNCLAYVLPTQLEGMPLTVLEAMARGCCCLVSDIPECREMVEDHAMLCRAGDPEDLRDRLQQLCDRPDLTEPYRAGARDYICGRFSWEDTVSRTLAVYETLQPHV